VKDFSDENKNSIAIAHNLRGYDGVFLMNFITNTLMGEKPAKALIIGTKIYSLNYRKIKLLDSYSFLPMALSEFPKTFNLKELKKGFFPHRFNTPLNQDYIGLYPDKVYYDYDNFSPEKREEFLIWYDSVKNNIFNFKHEFEAYCRSDVDLLTEGCLSFIK